MKQIVLRRLKLNHGQFEQINVASNAVELSTEENPDENLLTFSSWLEGDVMFYFITISDLMRIVPVDWRRFIYDREIISEYISNCVNDNIKAIFFDFSDKQSMDVISDNLFLALGDLETIFDVRKVSLNQIDFDERVEVIVEGEHKNGESFHFVYVHNIENFL